jgi:hypothetical protein
MLEKQCNRLATSSVLCDYLNKTKQEMYNSLSDSILLPPEFGTLKGEDTEDILREVLGLYKGWDYGPNLKVEKPKEEVNSNKLERFIKKGPKYAQLISNQTAYMNSFLQNKTKLEQRDIFKKLSDILQVKLNSPDDAIDHIINTFESPLELTLTASFDADNAPTGWKALETARSVIQEDGEELLPCNLQNLYCDKDTLIKEINGTHAKDELLILLPLKLDTGVVYGIWRENLQRKYYSNILI